MNRTITTLLALMAGTSAALAADKAATPVKTGIRVPVLEEDYSSGYYVKAEGLYQFGAQGAFGYNAANGASYPYSGNRFDSAFGAAVGAGLRYQRLRADLTVEARGGGAYSGVAVLNGAAVSRESFSFGAQSLMLNVAVDLATFGGFTPYVSAGAGVSRVEMFGYRSQNLASGAVSAGDVFNGARYGFSYALGAGLSYAVSPRTSLDLGYRMTHLGAYNLSDSAGSSGFGTPGQLATPNLVVHDVRLGLRYMFD